MVQFFLSTTCVHVFCVDSSLDIDECSEVPGACNVSHTVCVNEKGGYKCLCEPGYEGDGLNCTGGWHLLGSCCIVLEVSFRR